MLRFKPEVRIGFLDRRLADALTSACVWSMRSRVDVEINSINDSQAAHMAGSLHAYDLAIDFDTVGDKPEELRQLAEYLRHELDPQFDVILESDHVHVEWDARRPPFRRPA